MLHRLLLTCLCLVVLLCTCHADDTPPSGENLKIAGIVLKWIRGDKEANYQRVVPLIREAAAHGAQLVVTTECFLDGYAIQDKSIPVETYRSLGEAIPGGTYFQRLSDLAKELKIHLIAGMTEADGEERYNTSVLFGPDGQMLGKYRKQILGHELVRNTPGQVSSTHATPYGKMGMLICADRTNPDVVRRFKENGARFLICPSGGMFGPRKNDPIVQARSKETGLPIIFVHPAEFLVTGQQGEIISQTVLGDVLLIDPQDVGTEKDSKQIFYYELPVKK